MVTQHYRWDFIGLSTDTKPTPETSEKVVDGSTFYCSDNSKLYVYCKDNWYEKVVSGGGTTYSDFVGTDGETAGTHGLVPAPATTDAGKFLKADGTWGTAGSSVTVVQEIGSSTTDVMSQDATTKMVYKNGKNEQVCLGKYSNPSASQSTAVGCYCYASGANSTAIGAGGGTNKAIQAKGVQSVAIGYNTKCDALNSIALGSNASTTVQGVLEIGGVQCYNNTNYRLISGVHDGQSLHDGATVAQGNTLATSAPTTSTVGVLGQLYTDTTNMHTYQCTAISGNTYTWTQRW